MLSAAAAAAAVGVISTLANTAGFFGPVLFGYLNTRTGSLHAGYAMLIASATASGVLMLAMPGTRRVVADEVAGAWRFPRSVLTLPDWRDRC